MLVIPKKDYPKSLNALGLKRGDVVTLEIGEATPDYITLDPTTLKLDQMRDFNETRPPLVKQPKPKTDFSNMPLPQMKSAIQNPSPLVAPQIPSPAITPPSSTSPMAK